MICGVRAAIVALLAGLAPAVGAASGEEVYARTCAACHQADAEGIAGLAPPLAGTLGGIAESAEGRAYLASVLVSGMAGSIVTRGQRFTGVMPAQASLSNEEAAAVANFVLERFNASKAQLSAQDVASRRALALSPNEVRRLRDKAMTVAAQR